MLSGKAMPSQSMGITKNIFLAVRILIDLIGVYNLLVSITT